MVGKLTPPPLTIGLVEAMNRDRQLQSCESDGTRGPEKDRPNARAQPEAHSEAIEAERKSAMQELDLRKKALDDREVELNRTAPEAERLGLSKAMEDAFKEYANDDFKFYKRANETRAKTESVVRWVGGITVAVALTLTLSAVWTTPQTAFGTVELLTVRSSVAILGAVAIGI